MLATHQNYHAVYRLSVIIVCIPRQANLLNTVYSPCTETENKSKKGCMCGALADGRGQGRARKR